MKNLIIATTLLLASNTVTAQLHDRGNGMIYDDVQNITWLANANYFAESANKGLDKDGDGLTNWTLAKRWAKNLRYAGYNDWRLPTGDLRCAVFQPCTYGEFGHLFYNELGGIHGVTIYASTDPDLALFTNIQANISPFIFYYWTGSEVPEVSLFEPSTLLPQAFSFDTGEAQRFGHDYAFHAVWAVRDGDVIQAAQVKPPYRNLTLNL